MKLWQGFLLLGALNGFLGVALGAFGAHGLESRLTPHLMGVWNKAVHYQQIHALALVLVAMLLQGGMTGTGIRWSGWCFLLGILLFPGSLYILALSGVKPLGAVTPFGGVSFLLGWAMLARAALQS